MVDGGIWANNPINNAVTDALSCYAIDRRQIQILSLGCGETAFEFTRRRSVGGMIGWRDVVSAAMRAQSKNALGQAYLLMGKDRVMRLGAPESARPIDLDDFLRARDELPAMARSLVEASDQEIATVFFQTTADSLHSVDIDSKVSPITAKNLAYDK